MNEELRSAIVKHAQRIGANPVDFANVISYETGGTFDPWQKGPTTKWGQHVGFIQMGEPQRQQFGYTEGKSIDELIGASADYLVANGYQKGMGLLDMYSTINAGGPGKYNAMDGNTSVAQKVTEMTGAHRSKAVALLGGSFSPAISSYDKPSIPPETQPVSGPQNISTNIKPTLVDNTMVFENMPLQQRNTREQYVVDTMEVVDTPEIGLWDGVKAAVNSNWSVAWAMKQNPNSGIDPDFHGQVKAEAFKELAAGIPEQYWDGMIAAESHSAMVQQMEIAKDQMKNDQVLASFGWGGVALNMAAAILDPVAIGASIATEGAMAPVLAAAKASRLGRIIASAATAGVSNVAAEAAVGIWSPKVNQQSMIEAFGVGMILGGAFGAIGRNPALSDEAAKMVEMGQGMSDLGSVGARMPNPTQELQTVGSLTDDIAKGDVARSAMDWARVDVVARLSASGDEAVALLSRYLGQEAVGLAGDEVVEVGATVRKKMLQHSTMNVLESHLKPSYGAWLQSTGQRHSDDSWLEFNTELSAYHDNLDPSYRNTVAPEIKEGYAAYERFYDRFLKLAQNPGAERGEVLRAIPGVSESGIANYRPMYSDVAAIHRIYREIGDVGMIRVVRAAIVNAVDDLEEELIDRMAKGYVKRLTQIGYGTSTGFDEVISRGDKDELYMYLMNDLAINDETAAQKIADKLYGMQEKGSTKTPTARGKRRTSIDYNLKTKVGDKEFAVRDFFIKDMHTTAKRYADEMSGHIALAQMVVKNPKTGKILVNGVTTKSEWQNVIDQVVARMQANGASPKEVQATVKRLNYLYDNITGKPRLGEDANSAWAAWVRRTNSLQFMRLMQNMGITQAQELANITASVGLKAFIQGVPAFGRILDKVRKPIPVTRKVMKDGVEVEVADFDPALGPYKDQVVQELMAVTGDGYDNYLHQFRYAHVDDAMGETFGSGKLDKVGQAFDKVAPMGKRLVANISLMRHVNTTLHHWAMRAIAQKMANLAYKHAEKLKTGKFKLEDINGFLTGRDAARFKLLGLDTEKTTMIFNEMLKKAGGASDGSRLTALNLDQWDPKARAAFVEALYQWTGRTIQSNDVGNLAMWMTHPVAQMMFQFRSFVFGAYAKQTLHGIKHMDGRTMANLMLQLGAAGGIWWLQSKVRSLGEKDPEKYMDERAEGWAFAKAAVSRAGISSIAPMFWDQAMAVGASPLAKATGTSASDWRLDFRTSGTPTSGIMSIPVMGHYDDLATSLGSAADALADGRVPSQEEWKRYARATVGNHIALTTGLSYLVQDLPKKAPRDK